MLRFVTAVPGSAAMANARNSITTCLIRAFDAVSSYMAVSESVVRLELCSSHALVAVAIISTSLDCGMCYTLVAHVDTAGMLRLGLVNDDLVPAHGEVRIRVINEVRGSNDLKVAVVGQDKPLFANVEDGGDASVIDLGSMTAVFKVRRKDESVGLTPFQSMGLVVGTANTFVLASSPRGELVAIAFSDLAVQRSPWYLGCQLSTGASCARHDITLISRSPDGLLTGSGDLADGLRARQLKARLPSFSRGIALFPFP